MIYLKIILKLGLWNVIYVIWYRFSMETGIRRFWFSSDEIPFNQDFFKPIKKRVDYPEEWIAPLLSNADKIITGKILYYSYHWKEIGDPPHWFLNPFNNQIYPNYKLHWTKLPDFSPHVGDIKNIWEASRFEWVVTLARAYAITEDRKYLDTINNWLKDWVKNNPLNIGPNWKCGQEASIRVFNLLNSAKILRQENNPTEVLIRFIIAHLKRIKPNIRYAIAQNNNHGTSEAAGLLIGGLWLSQVLNQPGHKYLKYFNQGRKLLVNRINKLVAEDGSFSQHSVNYHRVFLDTLTFSQFWMNTYNSEPFTAKTIQKIRAAINWLYQLTDSTSGNAPNLGANDGALFLKTNSCDFRDFRPSIQIASLLFNGKTIFPPGKWDESCYWFDMQKNCAQKSQSVIVKPNKILDNSYLTIFSNNNNSWALLRIPHFEFRPSHNDVFHFDLWFNGNNILHDAGTFSYNPPLNILSKPLKSVVYHNTVSFDENEQMPSISRFLLSNWIQFNHITNIVQSGSEINWQGSYFDSKKNKHVRSISTYDNKWIVVDKFSGNFQQAILRFNFGNENYSIKNNIIYLSWGYIIVENAEFIEVKESVHAPYYFQLVKCNQLQIKVNKDQEIKTKIVLGP